MAFTPTFKERTAEDLLEHWGRWVVLGSGVSCCASREKTVLSPMITDDDALMIDGLMGRAEALPGMWSGAHAVLHLSR
ncbi:hypothetical protein [Pseudomonas mandelii]|jgi:hypothetical protein|uniref:hypothetical protein n=1 Tax=Pseudomonas mandelii TaxID=75612 RepID=UPI001E36C52C|nr:hypothetical protein [Pseudomonas mandelii]